MIKLFVSISFEDWVKDQPYLWLIVAIKNNRHRKSFTPDIILVLLLETNNV